MSDSDVVIYVRTFLNSSRTRLAALLAAAALLALGAAACGNDDESDSGATGPDTPTSTTVDPGADTSIPDLPINEDPSAVVCTGDPQGTFDAEAQVGNPLGEAEEAARAKGCEIRVVIRDGESLAVTEDFRPDRVNVATEDEIITEIVSLG